MTCAFPGIRFHSGVVSELAERHLFRVRCAFHVLIKLYKMFRQTNVFLDHPASLEAAFFSCMQQDNVSADD